MPPVLRPVPADYPRPHLRAAPVVRKALEPDVSFLASWLANRHQTGIGDWIFEDLLEAANATIDLDAYAAAKYLEEERGWPSDQLLVAMLMTTFARLEGACKALTREWAVFLGHIFPARVHDLIIFQNPDGLLRSGVVTDLNRAGASARVFIENFGTVTVPAEMVVANRRSGEDALVGRIDAPIWREPQKILEFKRA